VGGGVVSRTRRLLAAFLACTCLCGSAVLATELLSPVSAARSFGNDPYTDVREAAERTDRSCTISDDGLAALVLAATWPETGAGTGPPSPMTLSRYDTASSLYFESNPSSPYRRAFWHAGVGMWQFDSAGLGAPRYAAHFISTAGGAPAAASAMATRYCAAVAGGFTGGLARAAAWKPWHACDDGACEAIFSEIFNVQTRQLRGISGTSAVGSRGGMVSRVCGRGGSTQVFSPCFYVDPALAQGQDWWAAADAGRSPITYPFYVFENGGYEYRVWLREDTGFPFDVEATRPLGQNARSSLTWHRSTALCAKVSAAQTFCDVSPSHAFFDEIEWVAREEIASGYADGDFEPLAAVSRQAMAAFLYRLSGRPAFTPPSTPSFRDVGTGHQFRKEIEWLVSQGVTTGYPDDTFRPLTQVSREATAAFLFRLAGEPTTPPPPAAGSTFPDVSRTHAFWREIEWLVDEGIASGYADGRFQPGSAVSRQAMSAFLRRYDTNV
jgi:hypothetical protein